MHLAFYQPDIPQNLGSGLRLAACLEVAAHVIEPCGFAFSESKLKRAGMDYLDLVTLVRHDSWNAFLEYRKRQLPASRLLLLTTKASGSYLDFAFQREDILLLGRESLGAPPEVHAAADARLRIPISDKARSLNVIVAAGMVLGEGLRQVRQQSKI